MAMLTDTAGVRIAARPTKQNGFFAGLVERLQRFRVYRETLDELNRLSDRELADLDLSRHQIADVAYQAAYGA